MPPKAAARLAVTLLVDDPASWIMPHVRVLCERLAQDHDVVLIHEAAAVPEGDLAFFLGCTRLVPAEVLARNTKNLAVHESDLPRGRGWSPVGWQVLEGKSAIPVALFEAVAEADAGPVYLRDTIVLAGNELWPEIRRLQGEKTVELVARFVAAWPNVTPQPQRGEPTYYRRRGPADDALDPDKPLRALFDQLRIADNERHPAWFSLRGRRYTLMIAPLDGADEPGEPGKQDQPGASGATSATGATGATGADTKEDSPC